MSILLNGCTTCTLTKRREIKLDGNCTRMLRAILNNTRKPHPAKQQLYVPLPPILKANQVRQTRHARHSGRRKDALISDILQWAPTHGRTSVGPTARTYLSQLGADIGYSLEDLPGAINDWDGWSVCVCVCVCVCVRERERERERVRERVESVL